MGDAHLKVEDAEKGMKNPPEEEEAVEEPSLPTKYPEINPEMTHVSLVEPSAHEVKTFSKDDELFCETSPACFAEFTWKAGGTTFSMRAHTDNGYTQWSPNLKFHVESEVGPVTHEEL